MGDSRFVCPGNRLVPPQNGGSAAEARESDCAECDHEVPARKGAPPAMPPANEAMPQQKWATSSLSSEGRAVGNQQVTATGELRVGEPREVICRAVEEEKADLLVLGSHGYGALTRWVAARRSSLAASGCPASHLSPLWFGIGMGQGVSGECELVLREPRKVPRPRGPSGLQVRRRDQ